MSTEAVTMRELELESAELLPSRETLCSGNYHPGNTVSVTWVDTSGNKRTGSLKLAAGPVK